MSKEESQTIIYQNIYSHQSYYLFFAILFFLFFLIYLCMVFKKIN